MFYIIKTFVFVLILIWTVCTIDCLQFQYENGYSNCSTDDGSPIVFKGINLSQFQESQRRFNIITDNYYLCDVGDDPTCDSWWATENWKIANSIENGLTQVLTDERWQELKVFQLEDKYTNGTIKYTKLVSVENDKSVVPISWSFSKNASLIFCSGDVVDVSFCLKILFSDSIVLESVGAMEKQTLVNKTNWADEKWRSFLWTLEKGRVKLKKYKEKHELNILAHPFLRSLKLRHLFGHSTGSKDFVKIHNYNYLQTKTAGFYQIGRPFLIKRGRTCITLYVAMCKTCKMMFMMSGVNIADVEFAEEGTWRNVKIKINDSNNRYEQLYVRTIGNEFADSEKNYWAIDFVSLCSAVKFITIQGNYECEHPYPRIPNEAMEYTSSLREAYSPNKHIDYFRLLSFVNGTVSFIFKVDVRTKRKIQSISARCFEDFLRWNDPEGIIIPARQCTLRTEFFCGSIRLSNYQKYNTSLQLQPLRVSCSLRFLNSDHNISYITFFTMEDTFQKYKVPEAPDDLIIGSYGERNSIIIKWLHPLVGDENLLYFRIEMVKASHQQDRLKKYYSNLRISKPKRVYSLLIDGYRYESCTEYFIQVKAIGDNGPGFASTEIFTTPPYLPVIQIKMKVESINVSLSANSTESLRKCQEKYANFSHFLLILLPENDSNNSVTMEMKKLKNFLNITVPDSYRIEKKISIVKTPMQSPLEEFLSSVQIVDFKNIPNNSIFFNYTVRSGDTSPPIVIEVVNYREKLKFFAHTFEFLPKTTINNFLVTFILALVAGILLSIFILIVRCWWCRKRRSNKSMINTDAKTNRRPTTIENIYFLGDKVKLLDKNLYESISKIQEESVMPYEVSFKKQKQDSVASGDSRKVKIVEFEKYLKNSIANKELNTQFDSLPTNALRSCEIGQLECNIPKNRFKNIIPYDDTRVVLQTIENKEGSDYINASFIMGYKGKKSYIAAQGPKSLTINDFWRMIWQENVRNIVMLVNLVESSVKKVEKYWPNPNEDFQFGKVHIYHQNSESLPDYEIRCFRLVCDGKERKVYQYHFLNWPDNGVPIPYHSLVCFLRKTLEISSKSPILVHCCSGTSATGVFILCHICMQTAHQDGTLDVFKVAKQLREQRVNMIHDLTQYKLAHFLILECLGGPQVVISCNDDIDALVAKLTEPEKLRLQMDYLEEISWQYRAMFEDSNYDHISVVYPEKNKVKHIYPDAMGSVELERYPEKDESSCYINAIRVDGYRFSQRYIVTQQPMPNTLNDFWRMIVLYEVEVIVSLNEINLKDKKSCSIWPTEANSLISPVDFIIVKHHCTTERDNYDVTEVFVMVQGKKRKSLKVTIAELKGWKPKSLLPENIQLFLKFCGFVDSITRQQKNTVVTCYDGCTASGLYVATSYLVEMIKVQKNFDVCSTVKTIRRDRKQFITEEMQLAFLYEIAAIYIKGYQDYANFGACSQVLYNIYDYIDLNEEPYVL